MEKWLNKIICGDCLGVMKDFEDASIDTIVTDPPYGLEFMGKEWDSFSDNEALQEWTKKWVTEVLRIAKPGSIMLCFGGTRTFHRIACGIEDAGWEIRDTLMWVYGSGFPKSHNIGKAVDKKLGNEREKIGELKLTGTARNKKTRGAKTPGALNHKYSVDRTKTDITKGNTKWEGYGTALKPAYEPIIMAMKPKDGTYAENALKHDVAGLNIDGARIGHNEPKKTTHRTQFVGNTYGGRKDGSLKDTGIASPSQKGRFPANLIHDGSKEVTKNMGDKSRYFYCAKANKSERNKGLEDFEDTERKTPMAGRGQEGLRCKKCGKWKHSGSPCKCKNPNFEQVNFNTKPTKNDHPTVKPLALMEYLVELTKMPNEDQIYLDPFVGSGTTAMAVKKKNRNYIGIEQSEEYCEIARARIKAVQKSLL